MGTRARESERGAATIVIFLEKVTRRRVLLFSCVSQEDAASMDSRVQIFARV